MAQIQLSRNDLIVFNAAKHLAHCKFVIILSVNWTGLFSLDLLWLLSFTGRVHNVVTAIDKQLLYISLST